MTLAFYFFRQFFPPFVFGSFLFLFVLLLDRLFDIIDLVFNKGVQVLVVGKLFLLFIPTVLPLTFPMAALLACLLTFGRLSEENELSAVRAAGISLTKVLWIPLFFGLLLSLVMVPFNTNVAPWANRGFRVIYEKIANADPLINIEARKFFSIKNIKIFADKVDKKSQNLKNLFIYQMGQSDGFFERIYAESGTVVSGKEAFQLNLKNGQLEKFDAKVPRQLLHTSFDTYQINLSMNKDENSQSTRFRNFSSTELQRMIKDLKLRGLPTYSLQAEYSLRFAIAFAPLAFILMGLPLATVLKRGGRGFGFGVSIVVIFVYYTFLIFGLTMAEKGAMNAHLALWMGNLTCFATSGFLMFRLFRQ